MNLTGRVTKLESAQSYIDKTERVTILLNEATSPMYRDFVVPNVDGLKLDDELEISVKVVAHVK